MSVDRRSLFKILGVGGAGAAAFHLSQAKAKEVRPAPPGATGMLYDTTLCIGCKACVTACGEANGLKPDTGLSQGMYQAPAALSSSTKNIIKVFHAAQGDGWSFMKQQCMHCVDPACVLACPLSALTKDAVTGVVGWTSNQCIGCRCCQVGCPYNIPKFEWTSFNPKIVKCELCRHLTPTGKDPACCEVCPREAVIYGSREELLRTARQRIAAHPGRYFENRIYGEVEGGGTQVLYLSHVPFTDLGLPELGKTAAAAEVRHVQDAIYQGGITPVAVYGVLVAVTRHFWKQHQDGAGHEEHRS